MAKHRIHWNIHKGGLVLRNQPEVKGDMAYPPIACLRDCRFVVRDKARKDIRAGAHRSVHAWIVGTLCDCKQVLGTEQVRYNPHRDLGFTSAASGKVLSGAKHVLVRALGTGKEADYEVIAEQAY